MMMPSLLALLVTLLTVTQVVAGIWTSNNFFYKPDVGARDAQEKTIFDSGLDRVDIRLGNEHWLNDPAFGGNLQAAIAAIGSTATVLNIPSGTWPIASDLTVPANITLKLVRGAILNIVTGKTLSINGGLEAGIYQIFSCTGTGKVLLTGAIKEAHPEWWGAAGDGVTDDTAAAALAVTGVQGTDIPVTCPKTYLLTRQSSYVSNWDTTTMHYALKATGKIKLKGPGTIKISAADADYATAIAVVGTSGSRISGVEISGLNFVGTGTPGTMTLYAGSAVVLEYCQGAKLTDLTMGGTKAGISIRYSDNVLVQRVDRWVPISATSPRYTTHVNLLESNRCTVKDCNGWGSVMDGDFYSFGGDLSTDTTQCNVFDNVRTHNFAKGDATKAIGFEDCMGIILDTGNKGSKILNSYAYGYAYGVSVQGVNGFNQVLGNVVEKCWVGIALWNGQYPSGNQQDIVVANNIIRPDGGNGKAVDFDSITGMTNVGIALTNMQFGVTISNNTISNTNNDVNSDFCGILCKFSNSGYNYYHQTGHNIIGNHITMLVNNSSHYGMSKIWAMYLTGDLTSNYYQYGLNVSGNDIKVNTDSTNVSTQPIIYGFKLVNFKFSGNTIHGEFASDFPVLDIRNSYMVNISGNNLPQKSKGHMIKLAYSNGILVSGNFLGGPGVGAGAARYPIIATDCTDLAVIGNQKYYSQAYAENEFIYATGMDYLTVVNNHINSPYYGRNNFLAISGLPIEGMTRAAACVVTWTAHGKTSGDKIMFANITQAGWTALNGSEYMVTYIDANTFSIPVNTTGYAGDYVPATDPGTYWFQEVGQNMVNKKTH